MRRSLAATFVLAAIVACGCQSSSSTQRQVPSLYEHHGAEIACVAVYRLSDRSASAPGPKGTPGTAIPDAGLVARDAIADLLNGRERVRDLSRMEERAMLDVEPPYRLKKWSGDPDLRLLTRSIDEESPADLTPDQVRQMARWTMATQIVVGEVRRLSADLSGAEKTGIDDQTLVSAEGRGVLVSEVRLVLYDAQTGQPLLNRVYAASATFRHGDLKTPFDKVSYAQLCERRLLLNAAWLFVGDILPHYASDVHVRHEHVNNPGPYGPDTAERIDRYNYLYGR